MRRLWREFRSHGRMTVLFLAYWLATLLVVAMTWQPGGMAGGAGLLLLTVPLIAGALVGWWRGDLSEAAAHRSRDRITGGTLAGVLIALVTLLVTRGGIIEEVVNGMRGREFQGGELVEGCIVGGLAGALLGSAGAALAMILDRLFHAGGGLRPHRSGS